MTEPTTHCQICARAIKSKSGLIAHHGYQRPGQGWQTASCLGAKHLPYEVSRDRIPAVMEMVEMYITREQALLASMIKEPPAELQVPHRNPYARVAGQTVPVVRPEGFKAAQNLKLTSYHMNQRYEMAFNNACRQHERNIKQAKLDLPALQERYEKWVPPQA